MKQYIRNTLPDEFYTHPAYIRAFTLAMVYCFLIVMQLFTFEKFYPIVTQYMLPGGAFVAILVAGLIPATEVAALPYLLSMRISKRTRRISKWAVVAVPVIWLIIAMWLVFTAEGFMESGLLGATLPIASGYWLVLFALLLLWSTVLVLKELPKRR